MGRSIHSICMTMTGRGHFGLSSPSDPPLLGGVLVFFPSYLVMEKTLERWKQTDLYARLVGVGGAILVEPKSGGIVSNTSSNSSNNNGNGVNSSNNKYNNSNDNIAKKKMNSLEFNFSSSSSVSKNNPMDEEDAEISTLKTQFEELIRVNGKCILLAVCRYVYIGVYM